MSVEELEDYFKSATLPETPFKLNPSHTITDVKLFLSSHFVALKGNPMNQLTRPLYDRLMELKQYLEQEPSV